MASKETEEMYHIRISVIVHVLAAIVAGWLSSQYSFAVSIAIAFIIVFALGYLMERIIGKKGIKWWMGNGVVLYMFIWIISWTFFLNLSLA